MGGPVPGQRLLTRFAAGLPLLTRTAVGRVPGAGTTDGLEKCQDPSTPSSGEFRKLG
jgi:hypothetical protein